MIVSATTTVNGKVIPPPKPLICTDCGCLVAGGLEPLHSAWHRDTGTHRQPTAGDFAAVANRAEARLREVGGDE